MNSSLDDKLEELLMNDDVDVLIDKTSDNLIDDIDAIDDIDDDITIVIAGQVDSGKSTTIGTLVSGELDDGKGKNRKKVSKHPHELESGQTSDIATKTLTYDGKIITLVDLCGHKAYLKTTNRGIMNSLPDYGLVLFPSNRNFKKEMDMTKQHLYLLLQLGIPPIIVITKMDIGTDNYLEYDKSCAILKKGLSSDKFGRTVKFLNGKDDFFMDQKCKEYEHKMELTEEEKKEIKTKMKHLNSLEIDNKTMELQLTKLTDDERSKYLEMKKMVNEKKNDVIKEIDSLVSIMNSSDKIIPVISTSNVTGFYIDILERFIKSLKPSKKWSNLEEFDDAVLYIDSTFNPKDQGLVISGSIKGKGSIKKEDRIYIGPFAGRFVEFRVWSLRKNDRTAVNELINAKGTLGIKCTDKSIEMERKHIKKGMVALKSKKMFDIISKRFIAEINLFTSKSTIRNGFNAKLNGLGIDQTVRFNLPEDVVLESKGPHKIEIEFIQHAEFIPEGMEFTFREGEITGKGIVNKVTLLKDDPDPHFYDGRHRKKNRRMDARKFIVKKRAKNINSIS